MDKPTPERPIEIECVACNGEGCEHCDQQRYFAVQECPRKYVGEGFIELINIASLAIKGNWPVDGGTLNQSAWFLDLVQTLENEQNRIDRDIAERLYG